MEGRGGRKNSNKHAEPQGCHHVPSASFLITKVTFWHLTSPSLKEKELRDTLTP